MAIEPLGARAYVADEKQNMVYVFDLCSGSPIAFAQTGRTPHQVAFAAGRAFVANFDDATTTVIDTTTNQPVATIVAGGLGVAANAQTQRVYLVAGPAGVMILDAVTYRRVGALAMPPNGSAWSAAVDPTTNRAYVIASDGTAASVLTFDATSGQLLRTTPLSGPARYAITIGANGQVLAATYTDRSPELFAIDGATGGVLARKPIAKWTMYIAYQARTARTYATSTVDMSITVIDLSPAGTVSTTRVGDTVGGVAINPANGNVVVGSPGGPPAPQTALPPNVPVIRP
jgi:YVTN family beta-propeller protein